ncbi:bifunctional DNA-formamidopyrimidine glycosylase/DNA-(apurinic or apyrimidinic site) lyase [Reinekea blandensis]|uniref:Formamidopyrimidine-DNA glycosylase n=1 Tax=Reinekea blandensis MED297 TaxID=314283 RepID=A4BK81_9GAMM|nr:bifunctional DNA-formamidopyrimidine glycosylase/DNA-(apurinic or apyrimidinic site) lyase [Reinekea blandensis]EAR07448.1 formamidopyrimidine-DNA glycosylase [Reinekea sp. MED297] [Reinekea blandensis MED297]
MPELPEVETTCRGIEPHLNNRTISRVTVRDARLRWPIPPELDDWTRDQRVLGVSRRSKYILIQLERGTLIVHLGMSGSLRVLLDDPTPGKHDHVDVELDNGVRLRYNDPRRFGAWLYTEAPLEQHELIAHLGPEPLTDDFSVDYLWAMSRKRKTKIKSFIMDARIVVGVGNIYANEALFLSGIYPHKLAGKITRAECERLVANIKQVLALAINQGGTTLRDFVGGDGKPGYFAQSLNVYGRSGELCRQCGTVIRELRTNNRSTCFCRSVRSGNVLLTLVVLF